MRRFVFAILVLALGPGLAPGATFPARAQAPATPSPVPAPATDDEDDEVEEKEYWKDVDFGPDDFAEVRRFVSLFYIDPGFDKRLAWIFAANGALRSLPTPWEMLPADHWTRKRATDDFRKRYTGKSARLRASDPFVLVEADKTFRETPAGRALSPKDVAAKKKEMKQRQRELDQAFARMAFSEADFKRVVAWVTERHREAETGFRPTELYVAAAQGYLASLDPHSTVVSAKAWDESTKATADGSFEGIGAVLMQRGDETIVETPMEDQPAFKAGVRAGDVIVAVDGRPVGGLPLHRVVKRIRGAKDTPVVLTLRRLGEPADLDVTIVRGHIQVRNVQARMLKEHPDLGYVKVTGFVATTRQAIRDAIADLVAQTRGGRLRGLLLDLRNNSGGLLQESVDIADDFLEKGVIVSVRNPSDRDEKYEATEGAYDFPVVVLVDSGSASAAEILASAIQENGRGLVVGDRTFGKASVQTLMNPLLRRDYYIKLTVARYYAPSGRTLQVTGVIPDIPVPASLDEEPYPPFREEDLSHHLSRLSPDYEPPNKAWVERVKACERTRGIADTVARSRSGGAVKVDYALWKAADYLECVYADQAAREKPVEALLLH
jgi:C-terminal peptidase prc